MNNTLPRQGLIGRLMEYKERKEIEILKKSVSEAISQVHPVDGGIVIINNLTLNINYASGGGATVIIGDVKK